MVVAGLACDKIFLPQIVRFVVFAGPATGELLRFHFVRLMVLAGPATYRIFVPQIARFVVLTGPATDEMLRLHFVRLMVFARPACDQIFVPQIVRFVALTGPATDEILGLHFVRPMVFAGPASDKIFVPQIPPIVRFVVLFHWACPVFLCGVLWVGWVGGSSLVAWPLRSSSSYGIAFTLGRNFKVALAISISFPWRCSFAMLTVLQFLLLNAVS